MVKKYEREVVKKEEPVVKVEKEVEVVKDCKDDVITNPTIG